MGYEVIDSYPFRGWGVELLDFFSAEPHLFLLESSLMDRHRGRFSFLGFDPFRVFSEKDRDPFPKLRRAFELYQEPRRRGILPFTAGMAGYLSYDAGLRLEDIPLCSKDDLRLPDCFFGFYDVVLVIDHVSKKLHVVSSGLPEKNSRLRKKRALLRAAAVRKKLSRYFDFSRRPGITISPSSLKNRKIILTSNFSRQEYYRMIRRALEYIRRGDIYQVNLARRFLFERKSPEQKPPPLEIYALLRRLSPSHFGGYFDAGTFQIVSSSPERFLRLKGRKAQTRPMKGTRPRGKTAWQDQRFQKELRQSAKDKAELLMITDLERNDLGRVCEYGSVKVRTMRALEKYQTVFQTTATIEGKLRQDRDGFDLLAASFPGGSVTGCPKIRAMEIIEELEPARRGVYTGAMGYMDFNGDLDFNILIRTLLVRGRQIYFSVGSGIVADSTPQGEYEETLVKARALESCLRSF